MGCVNYYKFYSIWNVASELGQLEETHQSLSAFLLPLEWQVLFIIMTVLTYPTSPTG